MPRPLITANTITMARLLAMPLIAWFFYQGSSGIWWVLGVGLVVGATDYLDGALARRHGPTVFGGLLDPMADKVFVALTFLPAVDIGLYPAVAVGVIFVREFMITGLRSAFSQRGLSLKTSYIAKVKTWVQFQGGALVLLSYQLEERMIMFALLGTTIVGSLGIVIYRALKGKSFMPSPAFMALFMFLMALCYWPGDKQVTSVTAIWIVTGVCWLSGISYLRDGLPQLRKARDFARADGVRLLSALLLPAAAILALTHTQMHVAFVFAVIALELAVGGLDNLLSHHKTGASALSWSLRVLGASLALALPLILDKGAEAGFCNIFGAIAMVVCLIGVAREFYRGRRYYLDAF